jgi:hypothetical protein
VKFFCACLNGACTWSCQAAPLAKTYLFQGCFAFIDWEPRFARAELCLIADTPENGLLPGGSNSPWELDRGGNACANGRLHDYMGLAAAIGAPQISVEQAEKLAPATARAAEPIVSLCLYLCSEEPDIAGMLQKMPAKPVHPSPVRVKGGEKTFAADYTEDLGSRMAARAILRKAREEAKQPEAKEVLGENAARRGPAPHIRRAHWHTFWTGPKSGAPRKPALKWIPPIPVAFGEVEAMTAVIHRVSR